MSVTELIQENSIPVGLRRLVEDYTDYAKETVTDRAIPAIDGFKPVHRRILYIARFFEKIKDMMSSQALSGSVLKIHPHGDAAVYDAMVRMVQSSEYMQAAFLQGKGDFGKVYSTDSAAAARYTEVGFTPLAEEIFDGMNGVNMIPSFNGKYDEPELLPVSFPNLLVNLTQGIAVGLASNYVSFNGNEVVDATIEMAETGDIKGLLVPDFTTGGYYVYNESALRKIMDTGRGSVKVRGKWFIDGKVIYIEEIPYHTTVQAIKKAAEEIQGVMEVKDLSDKDKPVSLAVICSNKKIVEEVLNEVIRVTNLQMTLGVNMTVIVDNKPKVLGVKDVIKEWLVFREGVLSKTLKIDYDRTVKSIKQYETFVTLLRDEEKRSKFTETLARQGDAEARNLLVAWFPEVEKFVFDWILDMKLRQFSNLANREKHLQGLYNEKHQLEEDLKDIPRVIVRQLKAFNKKYKFPRKTEVTEVDYVFETGGQRKAAKALPSPVIVQVQGKFIKKIRKTPVTVNEKGLECMSNDVISFIDDQGRLLRVNLDHLEFTNPSDRGTYLPVYLEEEDNFNVLTYEVVADKKVGYMYKDGYASVIDYSEWINNTRITRITRNGVSQYAPLLMAEINLSKPYLLLMTENGKFGIVSTNFKHKNRTARTKLISVKEKDPIVSCYSLSHADLIRVVSNPERYADKLSFLDPNDRFDSEYLSELIQSEQG